MEEATQWKISNLPPSPSISYSRSLAVNKARAKSQERSRKKKDKRRNSKREKRSKTRENSPQSSNAGKYSRRGSINSDCESSSRRDPCSSDGRPPFYTKSHRKSDKDIKPFCPPDIPSEPPPKGWVIGPTDDINEHYKMTETVLGEEGGTGYAVRAVHMSSGEKHAIKIISKQNLQGEEMAALRNEVLVMRSLNHKNLIRAHGFFEDDKKLYIAMELCQGGELFQIISEHGRLREKTCVNLIRQMAGKYCYQ